MNPLVVSLHRMYACKESIAWLEGTNCATAQEAWDACPRYDWLFWLLNRCPTPQPDHQAAVLVCHAALASVPEGTDALLDAAHAWALGALDSAAFEAVSMHEDTRASWLFAFAVGHLRYLIQSESSPLHALESLFDDVASLLELHSLEPTHLPPLVRSLYPHPPQP